MPLALSDIFAALLCVVRLWVKDPEQIKIPKRSEALRDWCLPMLSASVAADEKEAEAMALFKSVKNLKEKYS